MHAFLIMVHNEFEILERLIGMLDNKSNHIFIHVDTKVKEFDFNKFSNITKYSKVFYVNRLNVAWGGYSQVRCELTLLKEAIQYNYEYYHLISGADLPIKKNDEIHEFFRRNKGKEFIEFDTKIDLKSIQNRVKFYYNFQDRFGRNNKIYNKILPIFIILQNVVGINRLKDNKLELKKGTNWFSITNELAHYVVENEANIESLCKNGYCVDEIFLHTLVYNSRFKNNIVNDCLRYIDWERGYPYTFQETDFDEIVNSNKIFARKFSSEVDYNIVLKIEDYLK